MLLLCSVCVYFCMCVYADTGEISDDVPLSISNSFRFVSFLLVPFLSSIHLSVDRPWCTLLDTAVYVYVPNPGGYLMFRPLRLIAFRFVHQYCCVHRHMCRHRWMSDDFSSSIHGVSFRFVWFINTAVCTCLYMCLHRWTGGREEEWPRRRFRLPTPQRTATTTTTTTPLPASTRAWRLGTTPVEAAPAG